HQTPVFTVAISPDERYGLSAAYRDPLVRMWELDTGKPLRTFPGNTNGMHAVTFSRDGRYVAGGDHDFRVWDRETGKEIALLKRHFAGVMGIEFLPDGEHLLSCANDHNVYLWNIREQQVVRSFQGHNSEVMAMELSPDAKKILTGSHDGTVRIWDTETGKQLHSLDGEMNVTSVSFGPNEMQVLFGGWMGEKVRELKLWDVAENRIMVRFQGHQGRVSCCRMLPGGGKAVSGSEDATVRLWEWEQ
ncbi:MAG: WD40 repeat domain-containing protein, partial [Gemmataceae bacterium]